MITENKILKTSISFNIFTFKKALGKTSPFIYIYIYIYIYMRWRISAMSLSMQIAKLVFY